MYKNINNNLLTFQYIHVFHKIELMFTRAFFYNFRLFTTPVKFLELLIKRFELQPPNDPQLNPEELSAWTSRVLIPVRLRVYNVIKTWLETYFCYEPDACTENALVEFTAGHMMQAMPGPAKRMMDLIRKRVNVKTTAKILICFSEALEK